MYNIIFLVLYFKISKYLKPITYLEQKKLQIHDKFSGLC